MQPKRIRANSVTSHREARKELLPKRRDQVIAVYNKAKRPLRDRELMEALGFHDMNSVRPVITDLIDKLVLKELGDVECPTTGRRVRVVALASYDDVQNKFEFANSNNKGTDNAG